MLERRSVKKLLDFGNVIPAFTPGTKVAVVGESATFRGHLAELIRATPGYVCVCACASAKDALIEIPKAQPDVVLMDIRLPGESGIECAARLVEKLPDIQIILLAVYKDIKVILQALKSGACGCFLKRVDDKEILAAIADVRAGGAPRTSEIARIVMNSSSDRPAVSLRPKTKLSPREIEVMTLLAEGLSNKEIGSRLKICFGTVRAHLTSIYKKMHVRGRTQAAVKYFRSKTKPKFRNSAQPL